MPHHMSAPLTKRKAQVTTWTTLKPVNLRVNLEHHLEDECKQRRRQDKAQPTDDRPLHGHRRSLRQCSRTGAMRSVPGDSQDEKWNEHAKNCCRFPPCPAEEQWNDADNDHDAGRPQTSDPSPATASRAPAGRRGLPCAPRQLLPRRRRFHAVDAQRGPLLCARESWKQTRPPRRTQHQDRQGERGRIDQMPVGPCPRRDNG